MITSTVIPTQASRQGLNQTRPCPRDILFFTCRETTQTISQRVSFMGDRDENRDLVIFERRNSVGYVAEGTHCGVSGTLLNNITFEFTLTVNLTASCPGRNLSVVNGTRIKCGEIQSQSDISSIIIVDIIGKIIPDCVF